MSEYQDVAARSPAAKALMPTDHESMLAIFDVLDEAIIVTGNRGEVTYGNRRALQLLNFSPERMSAGLQLADVMSGLTELNDAASGATSPAKEYAGPDGSIVVRSEIPFAEGMLYTFKDVSELRRAQHQLAECEKKFGVLAEKFNGVIHSVMRDVTGRQTRAAELMAEKQAAEAAAEAKSRFLATMSHEIRTPLNGILGYTDLLLRRENLAGDCRQDVGKIRSAGNALLSVVNDILDFSEIEAGDVVLDQSEFSLAAVLSSALEIVEPLMLAKGLRLFKTCDPSIAPLVRGDEGRLRQILLNLLNNAVKFTNRGSVGVTLVPTGSTADVQTVRFDVYDTGIGIAADKRHKLFERFSQVDASARRKYGGSGLGLAISRQLIERMGGRISFESAEGKGSIFSVVLDLPVVSRSPADATLVDDWPSGRKHILLVEDIPMNSEIAEAMIIAGGYTVDTVSDGAAAVRAVQSTAYDLVLMDIEMPDMDGVTATRLIRQLDHPAAATPIIAMTAHVIPREVENFLAAGMNDHIGKPFKRNALYAKLGKWCATKSAKTLPEVDAADIPLAAEQPLRAASATSVSSDTTHFPIF